MFAHGSRSSTLLRLLLPLASSLHSLARYALALGQPMRTRSYDAAPLSRLSPRGRPEHSTRVKPCVLSVAPGFTKEPDLFPQKQPDGYMRNHLSKRSERNGPFSQFSFPYPKISSMLAVCSPGISTSILGINRAGTSRLLPIVWVG